MTIGPWDFGGFDIVVLLILSISGIMAFARGFMREIVSLVALIAGLISALFLFGRFQGAANELISPAWLADGALGLGAFFIAYLLVTFVLRGGTKKLQGREPSFMDKLMGFGFGALRGLLIASLFVVVFRAASKDGTVPKFLDEATFYPILSPIATKMMSMPFAQLKDAADDTIEKGRELDNQPPQNGE
ncbi:MAG: CvpA family protein [Robiginitomaculum sp.]